MSPSVHELISPIADQMAGVPNDEATAALAYPAMRAIVEARSLIETPIDPEGQDASKPLPNASQLDAIRTDLEKSAAFFVGRKRLLKYVDDDENMAQLKPHQVDLLKHVAEDVITARKPSDSHACIISATGSGKSYMMGTFLEAFHGQDTIEEEEGRPLRSLILTPTQYLINQIRGDLEARGINVDVGAYYAKEKDLSKQVTVMTYQSFVLQTKKGGAIDKSMFDQVLLRSELLNNFDSKHAAVGPSITC